jgi:hypothetical protein
MPKWMPKVHYSVHGSPPLNPILSQLNPVYYPCNRFPLLRSNFVYISHFPPQPFHLIILISLILFSEDYIHIIKFLIRVYVIFFRLHITSSTLGPNIPLNTLFSNILNLRSFPERERPTFTYTPCSRVIWGTYSCSADQETFRRLCNPKVHYRVHKSPQPIPVLSQMNPVHTLTPYFLKIHFIIVLHLLLGLESSHFPSGFPTKIVHAFSSPHACYMPRRLISFIRPSC